MPVAEELLALLLGYGGYEFFRHQKVARTIPARIHVNGTRGKSSVTRLIAGGVRASGKRTVSKVTGTLPRLILPDGSEEPIFRPGAANIIEQVAMFRRASQLGAEVFIIECMALQPVLQRLSSDTMVRPTVGVITNARPDHLDVMGPTVRDVCKALCTTIPKGGIVFTSETELLDLMQEEADKKGAQLRYVGAEKVTPDMMAGFSYLEHEVNVGLALAVCEHIGVPREIALSGMHAANPDPGVMRVYKVREDESSIDFVDGFAANDPESTVMNWERVLRLFPRHTASGILVNTRSDRQSRSEQMGRLIATGLRADFYAITGDDTATVVREATTSGLDPHRLLDFGVTTSEVVYQGLMNRVKGAGLVMGVGNIGGMGHEIVSCFAEKGEEYDRGSYWPGACAQPDLQ